MKSTITRIEPTFAPRSITLVVESQEQLDALHRMGRTALAKERSVAGENATTQYPFFVREKLRAEGYGTDDGIETIRSFFAAVLAAARA